jgi:O-antigen/teichoic acid export membrane protein
MATWIFAEGELRFVMFVIILVTMGQQLTQTPNLIFQKRVIHQRLALIEIVIAVTTTIVSLFLAWNGYILWALLSINIITLLIHIIMLYMWKPIWRPRFLWLQPTVNYFLRFGRRHFSAVMLIRILDLIDDIWTSIFLGHEALGLYSRAYTFATYPRQVLALPVNQVTGGTYAELKEDRHRLSQAFFHVNALLIRTGFLIGGVLVLIAPEFIRLLLGEKWMPMLTTYQLMIFLLYLIPSKQQLQTYLWLWANQKKLLECGLFN